MAFHERRSVRLALVIGSSLLSAAAPLVVLVAQPDDWSVLYNVLLSVALLLTPYFALPTWRYGESQLLPWVLVAYPLLATLGDYWNPLAGDDVVAGTLLVLGADLGFVVFVWLTVVDDDGGLRGSARAVVSVAAAYAGAFWVAEVLTNDGRWYGERHYPWEQLSSRHFHDHVLTPLGDDVGRWVLPVLVLAVMVQIAVAADRHTRLARWAIVGLFAAETLWTRVLHQDSGEGHWPTRLLNIVAGVIDTLVIPSLVVLVLRRGCLSRAAATESTE
ncbi:MAG: hypothetical protein QOD98_3703 [Nocardioidaceae bacterium]|nr:hypothetical protein [Nocardioidaceae bacterium]